MRRTLEQFLAVFNSLAPSQRITFAVIAVLIPAGFLFFAWNGNSSTMVPLSYGKVFSNDELRNAEQALKEAGFSKFHSEGRQILAPASEVEKYNATLLQSGSLPTHWAEELEKKLESTNPFMSSAESMKQTREALLTKHLVQMILGSPDFEDADVLWSPASSGKSRFSRDARMKATVVVKPRAGHDLTSRQIQALRDAVTFAIPDLKSTDVTVYDQRKGEAYTPESENDPLNGKQFALLREASQLYESKIKNALTHISPEIVVTVNVELDPIQESTTQTVKYDLKRSIEQQTSEQKRTESFRQQPMQAEPGLRSNQPRSLANAPSNATNRQVTEENNSMTRSPGGEATYIKSLAAMPKVVTVSVLIPEDYYAKALEAQKNAPGQKSGAKTIEKVKEETEQAVKNIVAGAIPNPDPKSITVSSFVPVHDAPPTITPSSLNTVTSLVSQWGGAVALGLFAVWALWMLRSTTASRAATFDPPTEASINVPAPSSSGTGAAATLGQPVAAKKEKEPVVIEEEPMPTLNDRDLVQTMVRDNPEMAVAIIGKWLQGAR
jgi:flagellar biosynthesis/type III secretory pathway M-ring protein FliF/YscJ